MSAHLRIVAPATRSVPAGRIESCDDPSHVAYTRRIRAAADRIEARDAAYECPHGNLPGDRVITCGCFLPPGDVVALPVPRKRVTDARAA